MMKSDLEVITHKLPKTMNGKPLDEIRIYGGGDWHIGAETCDTDYIEKLIDVVMKDDAGWICLAGDILDNGLKNSKTNVYRQVENPVVQRQIACDLIAPLVEKNKVLCIVDGNHEARSVRETSISPLYDLALILGCEDLYRENMALMKICFGECGFGREGSQNVYGGACMHGTSRNKHRKYEAAITGTSFVVAGHSHQPELASRARIALNLCRGTAKIEPYKSIIVTPALKHGGYAISKEFEPAGEREIQYLTLHKINNDKVKRVDFHTIQV